MNAKTARYIAQKVSGGEAVYLAVKLDGGRVVWTADGAGGEGALAIPAKAALYIAGAGHVAAKLAAAAASCGFAVTVTDDRPELLKGRFYGCRTICDSPANIARHAAFGRGAYFALMSRDQETDAECLAEILKHDFDYAGMIGGMKKAGYVKSFIYQRRIGGIERVHMPIGLDIGARTPAEIAVAVTAELILARSATPEASYPEDDVIESLADGSAAVFMAVMKTWGSTPREAGTFMTLLRDGTPVGTTGGGSAEAEVIREACTAAHDGRARKICCDVSGGSGIEVLIDPITGEEA